MQIYQGGTTLRTLAKELLALSELCCVEKPFNASDNAYPAMMWEQSVADKMQKNIPLVPLFVEFSRS